MCGLCIIIICVYVSFFFFLSAVRLKNTYGPPTALHLFHHHFLLCVSAPIRSSLSPNHLHNSWKKSGPIYVSCSLEPVRVNCHQPSSLLGHLFVSQSSGCYGDPVRIQWRGNPQVSKLAAGQETELNLFIPFLLPCSRLIPI